MRILVSSPYERVASFVSRFTYFFTRKKQRCTIILFVEISFSSFSKTTISSLILLERKKKKKNGGRNKRVLCALVNGSFARKRLSLPRTGSDWSSTSPPISNTSRGSRLIAQRYSPQISRTPLSFSCARPTWPQVLSARSRPDRRSGYFDFATSRCTVPSPSGSTTTIPRHPRSAKRWTNQFQTRSSPRYNPWTLCSQDRCHSLCTLLATSASLHRLSTGKKNDVFPCLL